MKNLETTKLHFVYDKVYQDRYVPNGLATRGPMWQRFTREDAEYAERYCKTPLLALLEAEGLSYEQTLLSETNLDELGTTPIYLLEMLYSFRVWLPLKSGESFALNPFAQISRDAIEAIQAGRLKLVITHLKRPERNGYQWDMFARFLERLREFNIPANHCQFFGCSEDFVEHYQSTVESRPDLPRLKKVTKLPYFERGWFSYFRHYLAQNQIYTPAEAREDIARLRPKRFLNFNREPRAHRRVVAGWLHKSGLIKDGLTSFPLPVGEFQTTKFDEYREGVRDIFRDFELVKFGEAEFLEFSKQAPYLVDAPDLLKLHISWCTKAPFRDTYFSILTERLYTSESGQVLLTSKAFKAMSNMHPFVIVGAHRSLHFLREMGYRTFCPLIDERYDLEPDSDKRMWMVLREIERLVRLSDRDWLDLLVRLMPNLEHNFQHLSTRQSVPLLSYLPGL